MLLNEISFEKLIAPISEQKPCGEFLKQDRTKYRPLRNSFNQAKTSIKMVIDNDGLDDTTQMNENIINHWSELSELCINTLKNDTKDIEILGWLMTSQFILDKSLLGFSLSIKTLNTLLKNYWEIINPIPSTEPEENQQNLDSIRLRFLSQIFGESKDSGLLFMPMRLTPIIGHFTLADYLKGKDKNQLLKIKSNLLKSVSFDLKDIRNKLENLNSSVIELEKINDLINQKININALITPPAIKSTINEINDIKSAIIFLFDIDEGIKDTNQLSNETSPASAVENPSKNIDSSHINTLNQSSITSREQAFQQLHIISNYFKINEPHNPVSFLLIKCIRWGRLPLPELLKEWFKDGQASIENIFNLAGLNDIDKESSPSEKTSPPKEKKNNSSIFD
ncbi:type VI secretion system ImpA family N-terminal domain-containing protein [uncultured Shewanella sp.]|uniref:type VI secretion system protein TssA n=1 Tax=uncultured Shewanella sp. TaxID=173975 RepID=UPI002632A50D|nr:type VI secretion system ImpA family N-terminal domain-containing protein [uncultured Shewanella sp.]